MQYKIGLIGKDNQRMSKRWMSYSINNQFLDNLEFRPSIVHVRTCCRNNLDIKYTLQSYWYGSKLGQIPT